MTGIDHRQLYFELLHDYDPYADTSDLNNDISDSEMLYNLIEIRDNNGIENCDNEEEQLIYERFLTLIDLFKALGINPYYD